MQVSSDHKELSKTSNSQMGTAVVDDLGSGGGNETREWLRDSTVPPFLKKIFPMVEDPETDWIISWTCTRDSFIVHDLNAFSTLILPHYFKCSNFASFLRQLNKYDFRKVRGDRLEFKHKQGMKHWLNNIKKSPEKRSLEDDDDGHSPTKLELQAQLGILNKDRDAMRSDAAKLREQIGCLLDRITRPKERLSRVQCRQQQILAFLSNFVEQPTPTASKKRKLGDGELEKTVVPQSTQDLLADGNNLHLPTFHSLLGNEDSVAKDEDLPTKLSKIILEFEGVMANPSGLDACIRSLFH